MLWMDIRFAVRSLIKRPGFAGVAIATLALGIGANAAIFSVVNAVLLRPRPFPDVDRIVRVRGATIGASGFDNLSPMDFFDFRSRAKRFDRIAAFNNYADATLTGAGDPERIVGTRVSADFFGVLHVPPAMGRDFTAEDDQPDAPRVALLAYGFWKRRFGADPAVVGRTIALNSMPTQVIGVLPASFRHPFPDNALQPDVFVPFRLDRKENNRGGHYLQAIALLKPGASVADGQADLAAIARDLERDYPKSNTDRTVRIEPILDAMVGKARTPLYILLGTVVFVLLIACANLANLLLARSTARQREIAIRTAIGASRGQLVRQLIVESVTLATIGGAAGVVVASWAVRILSTLGANQIPRGESIAIDANVLLFALALSIATGIVFGVGPAMYASRNAVHGALKEMHRAQQTLVVAEIAVSLMLLVGAGLLVKSLRQLSNVDPGFATDHVLTLQTSLPIARYPEGDEIPFYQRVEERLASIPGVRRVGAINILPLSGNYSCDGFEIEGRPPYPPGQGPCAENRSVTPGYFDAMGIPLLRGRNFTRQDDEHAPLVIIISDDMARQFFPNDDPIGKRIVRAGGRTIVGIVGSVKHFGLDRAAPPEMYTPHAQQPSYHTMTLAVRTPLEASALMPTIQRELWSIDRDVPISNVKTMEQLVATSTTEPRFRTLLLTTFALLAVVLAVVGVGGVIAFSVSRRTREIGVRVALGATKRDVVSMVLLQGFVPTAIGVAVGVGAAFGVTRLLSSLLFGVTATDGSVFAAAAALVTMASMAATYLPARRAAAVDPLTALRTD